MSATSEAAREYFNDSLVAAAGRDDDRYQYVVEQLLAEFHQHAMAGVVLAVMPGVRASHEERLAAGPSIKDGATLTAYRAENGGSIKIMFGDGECLLLSWEDSNPSEGLSSTRVELEAVVERLPSETLAARQTMLAEGATLREMLPVAEEFARNGHPYGGQDSEDDYSIGTVTIMEWSDDPRQRATGRSQPACQRVDLIEKLASALDFSMNRNHVDRESMKHRKLAKDGVLLPMYASVAALAFETEIIRRLPKLAEIIDIASQTGLGPGTQLAYNDTDKRVYAVSTDTRDIVVHENIDLNEGSVFVVSLNKGADGYSSVDVHIAETWHVTFENYAERDLDDRADQHGFSTLVEYLRTRQGRPNVDELVAALAAGGTGKGLAYSYDMETGVIEFGPMAYRTSFLTYAPIMIDEDVDALRALRFGDPDEWNLEIQRHEIGSDDILAQTRANASKHMASVRASIPGR